MTKLILLMSLLPLFGCGHNTTAPKSGPEDGTLQSLYFSATHGYFAYSNIGYKAERLSGGKTRITVEVGNDRDRIFEEDGSVMDSLEAIVREYRMDKYDGHYQPKMDVLDGDSWSFSLRFADGAGNSCSGYMAYPPKGGAEALGKVEGILSRWLDQGPAEDVALVSFRYELHDENGSEVYRFKRDGLRNAVHFRKMGQPEGWTYYCGDTTVLVWMDRMMRWQHVFSYTGEDLAKEDTSRPRWILVAEYADGSKYEKMDYLDRKAEGWNKGVPSFTETGISGNVERYFNEEIARIENLSPEEKGKHSRTTYDSNGKPKRTINYDGAGKVMGGRDYRDPNLKF